MPTRKHAPNNTQVKIRTRESMTTLNASAIALHEIAISLQKLAFQLADAYKVDVSEGNPKPRAIKAARNPRPSVATAASSAQADMSTHPQVSPLPHDFTPHWYGIPRATPEEVKEVLASMRAATGR